MFKTELVNITLEVPEHNITGLERHLSEHFKVISYKIVPDTKELYNNDKHFQKLVKAEKQARKLKEEYINKFNK